MDKSIAPWTAESSRPKGDADWLSARVAAGMVGVSQRTIRRAIARGDLLAVKLAGVYRIAPADLGRYRSEYRNAT